MDKNFNIGFSLFEIKTDQFALFEENYSNKGNINLGTDLTFGLNKENKVFSVTAKFTFEMKKKPFMSIQITCYFAINETNWNDFVNGNRITFPKQFVSHMAMLTVGTSRGILHTKTENTIFNSYILPTTNVAEIISDDVWFDV
jgi:hypothetical protein